MAKTRTYGDRCGIARALDLVGERWSLLVVRELLLGPKRFTDLRAGLPGVSPDVLAQRLRELEAAEIVSRRTLAPPAASKVYELTDRGAELEPVVLALGRWGSAAPFPAGDATFGEDAFVLALKTIFTPAGAEGAEGRYELRLGEQRFTVELGDGRIGARREAPADPDAVIESDPATLADVLWHGRAPAEAERDGALTITGSREAAERFLRAFPFAA